MTNGGYRNLRQVVPISTDNEGTALSVATGDSIPLHFKIPQSIIDGIKKFSMSLVGQPHDMVKSSIEALGIGVSDQFVDQFSAIIRDYAAGKTPTVLSQSPPAPEKVSAVQDAGSVPVKITSGADSEHISFNIPDSVLAATNRFLGTLKGQPPAAVKRGFEGLGISVSDQFANQFAAIFRDNSRGNTAITKGPTKMPGASTRNDPEM